MSYDWKNVGGARYYWNRNQTSRNLAVLVHGINCQDTEKYWGAIPLLIATQCVPAADILVWQYDTNFKAFDKLRALKGRRARMSSAKELGAALHSFLLHADQHLDRSKYEKVALLGHSQGGLVCINSAYKSLASDGHLPIVGLCAASTPTRPNFLAKAHRWLTLGTNPQTKYLGSKRDFNEEIGSKMPLLRRNMFTKYITAIGDEVLENEQLTLHFEQNVEIQGGHNWPSEVFGTSSPGYHELEAFLKKVFQ